METEALPNIHEPWSLQSATSAQAKPHPCWGLVKSEDGALFLVTNKYALAGEGDLFTHENQNDYS